MIEQIATILVLIGAINWGAIGVFNTNLVRTIIADTPVQNAIYTAVGLSAIYLIYLYATDSKKMQQMK